MPGILRVGAMSIAVMLATTNASPRVRAAEAPKVVASIAPVHSLVAGVMRGVGTPILLIKGGASPHTYSLRPSEAKALASARLVFWIGEDLERFLVRPLKALAHRARKVALIGATGVTGLTVREGGVWGEHSHSGERSEGHGGHDHGQIDPHIWLDPRNAEAMTTAIARALVRTDPANAAAYRANAARLTRELLDLDRELARTVAPVRTSRFIVFHDAYQYFERRYRLAAAGALTLDPGRTPGAGASPRSARRSGRRMRAASSPSRSSGRASSPR